jgi:two-component system chemotaxis response regulator CheY
MYTRVYRILVLDDDTLSLYQTMSVLKQRDYLVVGAASTEQARWWLAQWPIDLMVAAVRVGGIGGLQFLAATRVQHPEVAGILIGAEQDRSIETDIWRQGAQLVVRPFEPAQFLMVVAEALASIRRRQRWPRKVVPTGLPVKVEGTEGKLVDASYGGLRFEFEGESYDLPSPMTVEVPDARLKVRAELVWSARGRDGVSSLCGVGILDDAPAAAWRRFVDRLE